MNDPYDILPSKALSDTLADLPNHQQLKLSQQTWIATEGNVCRVCVLTAIAIILNPEILDGVIEILEDEGLYDDYESQDEAITDYVRENLPGMFDDACLVPLGYGYYKGKTADTVADYVLHTFDNHPGTPEEAVQFIIAKLQEAGL